MDTLHIHDVAGPTGAPTAVLIHGWTATADTNFSHCYTPLAEHARVVAFDQRGHGRGLRPRRPFRLADCADDVIRVADRLGIDTIVPVGYSMGGAIAQLVWRQHPDRVLGLVLCATAAQFGDGPRSVARTAGLGGLAALARLTPTNVRRQLIDRLFLDRKRGYWEPWAIELAAGHDWRTVLEAGAALGTFRSDHWLGLVNVPTAVIMPTNDHVVDPSRQRQLAAAIPGALLYPVPGNHLVGAIDPARFVPTLLTAFDGVVARAMSNR